MWIPPEVVQKGSSLESGVRPPAGYPDPSPQDPEILDQASSWSLPPGAFARLSSFFGCLFFLVSFLFVILDTSRSFLHLIFDFPRDLTPPQCSFAQPRSCTLLFSSGISKPLGAGVVYHHYARCFFAPGLFCTLRLLHLPSLDIWCFLVQGFSDFIPQSLSGV